MIGGKTEKYSEHSWSRRPYCEHDKMSHNVYFATR